MTNLEKHIAANWTPVTDPTLGFGKFLAVEFNTEGHAREGLTFDRLPIPLARRRRRKFCVRDAVARWISDATMRIGHKVIFYKPK